VTSRVDLLRAHCYAAFDARGTEGFDKSIRDLWDGWHLWPAVEYEHAIERARDTDLQRRADIDRYREAALELLRATSHLCHRKEVAE